MNILYALIALSFLILIHEVGHFLVARWTGVKVLEFAIFMGPKIYSWRKGETEYSLRAIPMGGYVKMEGEEEYSNDERAFNKKPAGKKALIVFAGAATNIIIAMIIITIISLSAGYNTRTIAEMNEDSPLKAAGMQAGDEIVSFNNSHVFHPNDLALFLYVSDGEPVRISFRRPGIKGIQEVEVFPKKSEPVYLIGVVIGGSETQPESIISRVEPRSPATQAGLMPGDVIIRVDDLEVSKREDLYNYIQKNKDKPVTITVERKGDPVTFESIVPMPSESYYDLGVQFEYRKDGFFGSVRSSLSYSASTIQSVIYTISWLFTGKASFKDISGPVGIVTYIGDVVEMGTGFKEKLFYLLQITAFLSLNLGVMNLLPFPALDGGKLILIAIEKIRGKAIAPEKEAWISMVGFFFLVALLIATLFNDIPRVVQRFFGG
ncbi:MAG: RIP metalloprotease RseP [Clostridiaceae bacterium]|jgi:regulator of sigma E protease|nr:RIP metalloprotease RseP [Clostridiaceae bacterium]